MRREQFVPVIRDFHDNDDWSGRSIDLPEAEHESDGPRGCPRSGTPEARPAPLTPGTASPGTIAVMRDVTISDGSIRLGQLLKLAGLVEHGADAKALLQEGEVRVNGEVETRRGRQLILGDEIAVDDEVVRVTTG